MASDARGQPLRLILTPGQANDITQAQALPQGWQPGAVLADRDYDSRALAAHIGAMGAQAVIPPPPAHLTAHLLSQAQQRISAEQAPTLAKVAELEALRKEKVRQEFEQQKRQQAEKKAERERAAVPKDFAKMARLREMGPAAGATGAARGRPRPIACAS